MPYLNLDDNFADHPKVDALSDGAFRLHVSGLLYTARHRLDGVIPGDKVTRLMPRFKRTYLTELLDGGRLWLPHSEGYEVHDYLDWNKSRAEIEEQREHLRKVRSAAGKKGAKSRWQGE